jgi:hypothetical protein
MKKITLNSLMIAVLIGSVSPVFAVETSSVQPIRAAIQEKKEKAQDIKQKIASTTEAKKELRGELASTSKEIREDRKELIKNRINFRYGKMFARFQATIDRETAIMSKINSRIAKIKAEGGNTTDAEKYISDAKISLGKAQSALETLKTTAMSDTNIASSTTVTLAKETLDSMKASGQEIEKNLRTAHQLMQKSVGSLKGLSQLRNASSTKEQSN